MDIDGLSIGYGRTPVLTGLDIDIEPGSFVALLCASGCGKTTFLKAISGFLPASAGRIRIAGTDVTAAPPERRPSAMVFQSYALWPHMSVAADLGHGLKSRRVDRDAVARWGAEVLDLLRLSEFADPVRPTRRRAVMEPI